MVSPVDPPAGEQVFFHGHPSWRSILSFYLRGLLIAIVAGVVAGLITRITGKSVQVAWVIAAVLVVFTIAVVIGLVRRITVTYTITNQRLTIHKGILSREMHETRLARVQNVNTIQTFVDRLLRVGTVDFDTAAESGYDFKFVGVSDPHSIVTVVDKAIHEMQQPGPPAADPTSDVG